MRGMPYPALPHGASRAPYLWQEGGRRGGGDSKTKEDFEDMRLTLQESDYGNFLANEPRLDPKVIGARATQKWVREFKYFRATATGDLARFLDFISYEVGRRPARLAGWWRRDGPSGSRTPSLPACPSLPAVHD